MATTEFNDKEFIAFCLKKYFRDNPTELKIAIDELNQSKSGPAFFLHQYLLKKNRDEDYITAHVVKWHDEYNAIVQKKKNFKVIRSIFLVALVLCLGAWFLIGKRAKDNGPDLTYLYVITTSGFRAHDTPATRSSYVESLKYGDTVLSLRDTVDGWVKFQRKDKILYGPAAYLVSGYTFQRYDSLFDNYHFQEGQETINSKMMFCVYDFIHTSLRSSPAEWYIPLEKREINQLHHAVLSVPTQVASVKVVHETPLEKFHLILLAKRNAVATDSITHYLLLLELLPDGLVIKKEDYPLSMPNYTCHIAIDNFENYNKGIIDENVFFMASGQKKLRLRWNSDKACPVWDWIDE